MATPSNQHQQPAKQTSELKALGFIIVVLFPVLSVFSIGAYGFIIWMIQAFGGVVGH